MSRTPFVSAVFAAILLMSGCERPVTEAASTTAQTAPVQGVSYPVESQLDKFEFRPNECAGELKKIVDANAPARYDPDEYFPIVVFSRRAGLTYLPGANPEVGGAALNAPDDSEWLSRASWYQSLDLNDDGLCDFVETYFAGDQSTGQGLVIAMRTGPGYKYEKDFREIGSMGEAVAEYFDSKDALDWRHGGPMRLPGTRNDQFIVFKIYPKAGGMPYIVMPSYEFTRERRADFTFFADLDEFGKYEFGGADALGPRLYIYRWDPALHKFVDLTAGTAGRSDDGKFTAEHREDLFGKATAEYWAVRAYLAERYLQDGLKEFKAHDYLRASFALEYATAADPRNPDLWAWLGNLEYASGHFKDAARYFETAIAWTHARNLPVPPTLYFNLGMAYESACWNEMQDRREGDKPGCEERMSRRARAAYEAYLKAAPQGERTAEVRQRLADMARGVFREPVVDQAMAGSAGALDRMAAAYAQAQREMFQAAKAKEEAAEAAKAKQKPTAALDPETGQPRGAPTADVFKLTPADLKKIDDEINRLLRQKGKTFPQSRIDWMVAYKAKFPQADLNDMIDRPEYYEALPWVKKWRATYRELSR
jgi:tetratricopeptide (TPR) repeat protein